MLKLKKLQILGFKSFCDRTELKFQGDGVAAIVGPNGCGKSNIADAISWVLGEQSAKSLRGSRMEDVIFIGTRDRKPTGMAEVSLTLIDPEEYEGNTSFTEPEVDIQNEPFDDWDEAGDRATAAEDTERHIADVQPLGPEEVIVENAAAADDAIAGENTTPENTVEDSENAAAQAAPEEAQQTAESDTAEPQAPDASASENAPQHVVLKIRRRKFKTTQFKAGELVVTRRLFRSGESEYLLNGKLCRLRDIQDIFMGTGLGPESYAIIEQGRIGQILSSKPYDRRAIIEEAAGITKFKTKKRLAEARLEQSKLNLARINDIFDEVTRQMNSLKRQAAKAERYAKLRDEMREKLRLVLASKFTQLEREAAQLESELASITAEMQTKNETVQRLESEHGERTQRGYAIEEEAKRNTEHLNTLALEMERSVSRRHTNEERCAELDARSAAALAELERTREQLGGLQAELNSNRSVLESAAADVAAAQSEASLRQHEAATATETLAATEQSQEARRSEIMEAVAAASAVHNRMAKAEEHSASLERELHRLQQETAGAQSQITAFGGQRGQIAFEFESVSQKVSALTAQIAEAQQQVKEKKAAESEAKIRLDSLRAEYASALGKRGSLEALIAEHGYTTESVKRLFQSGAMEKDFAPAGILADFLEVDDQYERVVEDFLRDELNYIVVKSWDAADQGLQILRNDVDGRATFLVHSEDSQEKFSFLVDQHTRSAVRRDAIVPLKSCIRVLNGFGKSLEGILPKLGNGYIAPDSATAREMALENPNAFFLAPNGETFHNLTVTGGKQRTEGPLSMKRELRELQRTLSDMEQTLRADEARTAVLGREITELTSLLVRLEEERREAEKLALTSGHALQQLEAELEKTQQRLGTYEAEISRVRSEREEAQQTVAEMQQESAQHESHRKELESEVAAIQSRLATMKESRDLAVQTASQMSARVAALEERRIAASSALQRIETLVSEVNARVASLEAQIESAHAEKQQRLSENARLAEQLIAYAAERQSTEARGVELQKESEQVRARMAEIEHQLREVRQLLDAARDRRGELSAAIAKLTSDAEYMAETCRNELNLGREELLTDTNVGRVEGEALALEDTAYREMRTKLENMGPVNMMALEEYKKTAERHSFLETQRKDLLDSIENTLNSIKEIDAISRQKFEEAFERINENFQFTFRKLFGGGQAFMRLTDQENSSESGIDVIASPPGKKLQNVLLLSGGEKALTALALLVGIFQFQPSPFCILDEVDAPLDEANVGRFTDLVKEMSVQTQFVIITHNKKTMGISPTLYGVTMQEPGVSKIVSVRFGEEAKAAS
ncbi:MAG TPA: chromosome segregation protein SMC [Terriglobales bacterium]|nr:chromosome segregation protein SMC [Terriglobales bacterium]